LVFFIKNTEKPGASKAHAPFLANIKFAAGTLKITKNQKNGGEDGIRTHVGLQTLTRFPSVRHQPLGHLSIPVTGLKPHKARAT
jgi:hypothetical protein